MSGGGGKNVELQPQMRVCFNSLPDTFVRSESDANEYSMQVVLEIQNEVSCQGGSIKAHHLVLSKG